MEENNVTTKIEENESTSKKEKSFISLVSALGNIYNRVNQTTNQVVDENEELAKCVKQAYDEWQTAEKFFHNVTDPDLIDHAIYKLEASKARYTYLLKQAKANGIRMNIH